jgi:hypothetical protein
LPINLHFTEVKQDKGLNREFRKEKVKSGFFNWKVMGWRIFQETGFN